MTPLSLVFSVCREQNRSLGNSANELMPLSHIAGVDDAVLFGCQQILVRIEALFSLAITGVMASVHGAWELVLLNHRIVIERGLLSFALIKVNVLFLATVGFSIVLEACALIAPELSYSWLKLHLFIDVLIGSLLAEIPVSLQELGERLNIDLSTLPDFAAHTANFREELRLELVAAMDSVYTKHASSSFSQFDWTIYKNVLEKILKQHYAKASIDAIFAEANKPIRARFFEVMKKLIEEARRDLIQREVYRPADFLQESNGSAQKAAELLAIYSLVQSSQELADGYLIRLPSQTFFIAQHTTSDPLEGVQSRGFGVEVTPEGLYARIAAARPLVAAVENEESVRDLLQEEFVDESQFQQEDRVVLSQNVFRELSEDAIRKKFIAEARRRAERENGINNAPQTNLKQLVATFQHSFDPAAMKLLRQALFYGIQPHAHVTEAQKQTVDGLMRRFGTESLAAVPAVLLRQVPPTTIANPSLRNSVLDLLRSNPMTDARAAISGYIIAQNSSRGGGKALQEQVGQNEPLQQALRQVYALSNKDQALLYRLLGPRSALDPGKIGEQEVRDAYLHLTTLHHLVKVYILDLQG